MDDRLSRLIQALAGDPPGGPREWRDISLDLSRNTVCTHLKQIFSRCEVRSQRELLHLLATGPQDL